MSTTSVALVASTAALGPSAAVAVRPGGGLPPYAGHAHPSAALVTTLLIAAAVTGVVGVALTWLALRRGWRPPWRPIVFAASAIAVLLCLLPHIGSADPESYAAYGREAAIGIDPYSADPSRLADRGDPYGRIVEDPWRHTPSVYGPLATLEQDAAARIAGDDPRTAVWLLQLVGGLAFVITTLLLLRLTTGDVSRSRVVLLWAANPLMLWQLVAGAHVDTVAIALAVGALVALRRSAIAAGLLIGAATIVKLPAALVGAGIAWTLRQGRRRLLAFAVPAVVVVAGAYAAAGSHALDQARTASRYVSRATPWRPLATLLDHAWGRSTSREFIGACALLVGIALLALLFRAGGAVAMPAALIVFVYVLVTPYALPWYDGLAWALLVLVAASRLDLVLLAHTVALSLAYIPGRAVPLPSTVDDVTSALRNTAAPTVLGLLVAVLVVQLLRQRNDKVGELGTGVGGRAVRLR